MTLRSSVLAAVCGGLILGGCGGSSSSSTTSGNGAAGAGGGGAGAGGSAATGGTATTGGGAGTTGGTGGAGNSAGAGGTPNVCGDGVALDAEECDGADLKGADCTLFGYSMKQEVTCTADCKLDSSACAPTCDGALLEPGEECDGSDLGNHDCTEAGYTSKAGAKCNATCTGIETANCKSTCDGAGLEPGEVCDGVFLDGHTCQDAAFGFDSAAGLKCTACQLDPSGCKPTCDGNKLETGEACDGALLGGKTCADFGFVSPAGLSCSAMCDIDTSGCTAACGNGVMEPGEECDGSAPVGQACSASCTLKLTTVINEVWYDPPGADGTSNLCFIELRGAPGLDLTGYSLKFTRETDGLEYVTPLKLDGQSIGQNGYFVVVQSAVQEASLPPGTSSVVSTKADMQNGPNNLLLLKGAAVADALGYGTFAMNFQGEGSPAPDPSGAPSLARLPDGSDTDDNAVDFVQSSVPTPGAANLP